MSELPVRVSSSGSIVLANEVVCDGFVHEVPIRVQTHVHSDHMSDFDSSKGYQTILASSGTHALLCAQRNADLPYRSNFVARRFGDPFELSGTTVTLLSAEHMLGAAQVQVELDGGLRVGYSGDFSWPLDDVIEVDVLVVDATYGSPKSIREYTQADAESAMMNMIQRLRHEGPIYIVSHQGTLQRALQIMAGDTDLPLLGSAALLKEAAVYREFGFPIDQIVDCRSPQGREILRSGSYVRFFGQGDQRPISDGSTSTLKLSAFMARPDDPIVPYSSRVYGIAMSNHADFAGTLEYVQASRATRVVVDNSRGGHPYELAEQIRLRLGVEAEVAQIQSTHEWGR